jgi:hypothetical protein
MNAVNARTRKVDMVAVYKLNLCCFVLNMFICATVVIQYLCVSVLWSHVCNGWYYIFNELIIRIN